MTLVFTASEGESGDVSVPIKKKAMQVWSSGRVESALVGGHCQQAPPAAANACSLRCQSAGPRKR